MGTLEAVLAAVDNAKRVAGRNISDLVSDPRAYGEKIVGALRNQNAGVSPTIANGELTNRPLTMEERVENTAGQLDFGGGLGVIKPKGGNWLSGQVEQQLKRLKRGDNYVLDGPVKPEIMSLDNWIASKLTKYVKNDMASPNDPIRLMADKFPAEKAQKLAEAEARVQALRQKQEAQAATRGVPPEMLTRTRQDVLAAEEARDLIAENSGLHVRRDVLQQFNPETVLDAREAQGFPAKAIGATPEARAWENFADAQISPRPAKDYQLPDKLKQDPWLAKVDPNTPVYSAAYDVGRFEHLIDELRNSLREGRLTPEQLQKMPIDQAVRHVAEINALRAVEANKTRAMDMADMPIHKEYPESGMSWRQLASKDRPKLEKWLKDEGDAMGHCVGGYCEDVASGSSNIYSLRDAKGKPSVTIETAPAEIVDWDLPPEVARGFQEHLQKNPLVPGLDDEQELRAYHDALQKYAQEAFPQLTAPIIRQIKGKNNAMPPPEALPFIQDFIRSGKWGDIQDVGHTGLTPEEIDAILKGTK